MEEQSYINWQEAAVHTRSKREVYELLKMKGDTIFHQWNKPIENTFTIL